MASTCFFKGPDDPVSSVCEFLTVGLFKNLFTRVVSFFLGFKINSLMLLVFSQFYVYEGGVEDIVLHV